MDEEPSITGVDEDTNKKDVDDTKHEDPQDNYNNTCEDIDEYTEKNEQQDYQEDRGENEPH